MLHVEHAPGMAQVHAKPVVCHPRRRAGRDGLFALQRHGRSGRRRTVTIAERTQYPFDEQIRFEIRIDGRKVKTAEFPLRLRIPGWCKGATVAVNGQAVASPGKAFRGGSAAHVAHGRRGDAPPADGGRRQPLVRTLGRRRARPLVYCCASANNGRKSATGQTDLRPVVLRGAAHDPVELHAFRGGHPPRTHCGGIQGRAARHRRRLSVDAGKRPGGDQGRAGAGSTNGCSTRRAPAPSRQHQRDRQSRRRDHADPPTAARRCASPSSPTRDLRKNW